MDRLPYIDLPQEDGTENPSAGHTRVKAATTGAVATRSNAGVESALGGAVSVASAILTADFASTVNTPVVVPGTTITIPPGKKAAIFVQGAETWTGTTLSSQTYGLGIQVNNPANANGTVLLVNTGKINASGTGAAAATAVFGSGVQTVAANATATALVTFSFQPTAGNTWWHSSSYFVENNSTSTSAIVDLYWDPWFNGARGLFLGSGLFALIS